MPLGEDVDPALSAGRLSLEAAADDHRQVLERTHGHGQPVSFERCRLEHVEHDADIAGAHVLDQPVGDLGPAAVELAPIAEDAGHVEQPDQLGQGGPVGAT